MLEKVLVDLVLDSIGDYIEKLNSENLKVGLWKGHVELVNLELKRGALCKSGALPYSVKHSVIGRLSLVIPWNSLQTSPVVVSVENVCVVLGRWHPDDVVNKKIIICLCSVFCVFSVLPFTHTHTHTTHSVHYPFVHTLFHFHTRMLTYIHTHTHTHTH